MDLKLLKDLMMKKDTLLTSLLQLLMIGEIMVLLLMLKIKVNVVLAGLLEQSPLLKVNTLELVTNLLNSLKNNLLTVIQSMMQDVMVDCKKTLLTT